MRHDHLQEVSEDDQFVQGDILCRAHPNDPAQFQWAFIINADCDIAQRKNSNLISWMEILPATLFIERYWAPGRLDKLVQKQLGPICEQLNALLKLKNLNLRALTQPDLFQWVHEEGADAIIRSIGVEDIKVHAKLTAIDAALRRTSDDDDLSALLRCAEAFSQRPQNILDEAKQSLEQPAGFADYVFVPGIPGRKSEGFVVRLRDISGIRETDVFRSLAEAKINDRPYAFYRIGRFSDALRYQIVQKMAFLFSRIGSPRAFEEKCKAAAHSVLHQRSPE